MAVPITGLYAALSACLIVYLALNVALTRRREKIGVGDKGNQQLIIATRAHANTVENVPIALLLMLIAELGGVTAVVLHGAGILLVAGRLAHTYGYVKSNGTYHVGRFYGTLFTWLIILLLALVNIVMYF